MSTFSASFAKRSSALARNSITATWNKTMTSCWVGAGTSSDGELSRSQARSVTGDIHWPHVLIRFLIPWNATLSSQATSFSSNENIKLSNVTVHQGTATFCLIFTWVQRSIVLLGLWSGFLVFHEGQKHLLAWCDAEEAIDPRTPAHDLD